MGSRPSRPRGRKPSRGGAIALALVAVCVAALALSAWWGRGHGLGRRVAAPVDTERTAPVSAGIRVEVLNGSGQEGAGSRVAKRLRDSGFQVIGVRNADRFDYPRTLVAARGVDLARARAVARCLAGSQLIRQRAPLDWDVTVIVGRDEARETLDRP